MKERIRVWNAAPANPSGDFVLYWCRANRRTTYNHALARAVELANELDRPLLAYEFLDPSEPYASDRTHAFALEGVGEIARSLERLRAGYRFDTRENFIDRLAARAAAVVCDDHPLLDDPPRWPLRVELVDSSAVVPMSRFDKREYAAYTIRPKVRKLLDGSLQPVVLPALRRRWSCPAEIDLTDPSCLPVDHSVPPSGSFRGGPAAARAQLRTFLRDRLRRYAREKNEPSAHATSDLSPWLRYGHISAVEIALRVRGYAAEHGLIAEEFLEELIVRRDLAFNFARFTRDPRSLDALPEWARETLGQHARDRRPFLYKPEQFERATTHDTLWNAAQTELLVRGKIHGYYRMYWGKKIIEWSRTPQEALRTMIHLNDRYALDGRDPNSYTNILWCFGLHDRPWPERPVFGKIRYMSREGMERKTNAARYIEEITQIERSGI